MYVLLKLETIGDAFICVGGLHNRPAPWHAQQVAWMAIKMMGLAKQEIAPDGNTIKVWIGLYSHRYSKTAWLKRPLLFEEKNSFKQLFSTCRNKELNLL